MIVSHDRAFLDDTVDDIILFANKGLSYHAGNYSTFVEATAEQRAMRAGQRDALARKAEKVQASITKEKAAASKSGDSKKQVLLHPELLHPKRYCTAEHMNERASIHHKSFGLVFVMY